MDSYLLRLKVDRGASGLLGSTANEALIRSTEGMAGVLSGGSYLGYTFKNLSAAGWRVLSVNAFPGLDVTQDSFLEVIVEETGSVDITTLALGGAAVAALGVGLYLGAPVAAGLIATGLVGAILGAAILFGIVFTSWSIVKLATGAQVTAQMVAQKDTYKTVLDQFNALIAGGTDPATAASSIATALKAIPPLTPPGGGFDWIIPVALLLAAAFILPPLIENFTKSQDRRSGRRTYDPAPWVHGLAKRAIERRVLR